MIRGLVSQVQMAAMGTLQLLCSGSNARVALLITVDQGIAYIAPQGAAVAGFGLSVTASAPLLLRIEDAGEGICSPWVVSCTVSGAKVGVMETIEGP